MKQLRRKPLTIAVVVVASLALILLYPFKTTVVPEWRIRIVDDSGKPVSNISVREQWRHHTIETNGHNESRTTDGEGNVSFPRRAIRASFLHRLIGRAIVAFNVHRESGPKAAAIVLGPYLTSRNSAYDPGKPSPETIVVRPQP